MLIDLNKVYMLTREVPYLVHALLHQNNYFKRLTGRKRHTALSVFRPPFSTDERISYHTVLIKPHIEVKWNVW